MMRIRRD